MRTPPPPPPAWLSRWLFGITEDCCCCCWNCADEESSINEMHLRNNPGFCTMSSAGPSPWPIPALEDAVTVAATAAAAAAATSEPVLSCAWPLLWLQMVPMVPHRSSALTSGASSSRRLSLCENPDESVEFKVEAE